jgi:hypothetical protein
MTNPIRNSRLVWQTASGTVCLRDKDDMGESIVREFWVPPSGGYLREIDDQHPGTLGRQVSQRLGRLGHMLSSDREGLLGLIRREYRARCAHERWERERELGSGRLEGRQPRY